MNTPTSFAEFFLRSAGSGGTNLLREFCSRLLWKRQAERSWRNRYPGAELKRILSGRSKYEHLSTSSRAKDPRRKKFENESLQRTSFVYRCRRGFEILGWTPLPGCPFRREHSRLSPYRRYCRQMKSLRRFENSFLLSRESPHQIVVRPGSSRSRLLWVSSEHSVQLFVRNIAQFDRHDLDL